jgi:Tol biopolymer transport system component
MASELDRRVSRVARIRIGARWRSHVLTSLATFALLLSLPGATSATYPGSLDGRLASGINVDGNTDIYTFLPNGQALHRLTTDPLFDACPAWSADGKHVAWCHGVQRGGVIDVWTMKLDGTEKRQVTDLGGRSLFPDFAPDGSRILFSSLRAGATNFDLFVIGVDGAGLVQLTSDAGFDGNAAWSPDGARIVFTSDRSGVGQVYVMDADGGNVTQLTFDDAWKDQVPDWSPDGLRIAYAAGDPGDILVMDADGSDQHVIVAGSTDDFGSAWSPDGDQIAFVRFDDRTVRIANADGSDVHIVRSFGLQAVPGWQPRGER